VLTIESSDKYYKKWHNGATLVKINVLL